MGKVEPVAYQILRDGEPAGNGESDGFRVSRPTLLLGAPELGYTVRPLYTAEQIAEAVEAIWEKQRPKTDEASKTLLLALDALLARFGSTEET